MFFKDNSNMEKELAQMDAKKKVHDATLDYLISSEISEDRKVELRILKAHSMLLDTEHALVKAFTMDTPEDISDDFREAQKAVLAYIIDLTDGLKQYHETAVKMLNENK